MSARTIVTVLALLQCGAALAEPTSQTTVLNRRILPNQGLAAALHAIPLPDAQVNAVIGALKGVFDFTVIRPGDQFRVVLRHGELDFFNFRRDPLNEWQVRREGNVYKAWKRSIETETRTVTIELDIQHSLYNAALAAGESPEIAMALADVFAWDIDFFQDVRKGDKARAVVEKVVSRGRHVRYGDVLAASYVGELVGHKRVFRHTLEDGQASYFQQDGSSARKSFLKSPLKYAHVTSKFGSRFHPVLKYEKAHNGVDYGAAIGTQVWAVADGTVTRAGYFGANGNLVCLRHLNSLETCYAHLSQVRVKTGQRVRQKDVIALTGNTGRSTGPHLHYALKRGGSFVNPLNQKFPRAEPIPPAELERFAQSIRPLVERLEQQHLVSAAAQSAVQ
jgi:murein DD-endopeptidase MepM/ murein hydrolase activator NlpD